MLPLRNTTNQSRTPSPEKGSSSTQSSSNYPRHIVLPGLNLRQGVRVRYPSREEDTRLRAVFPDTVQVRAYAPFLVICVRSLPPKPWPLSVVRLPLFLTTDPKSTGFGHGNLGFGPDQLTSFDAVGGLTHDLISSIFQRFHERDICVLGISFFIGPFWVIYLGKHVDQRLLPRRIAGVGCEYVVGRPERIRELAKRVIKPSMGTSDNTDYTPNLRPGTLLVSHVHSKSGKVKSTSSGVAVRGPGGTFITVASHGFEHVGSTVHHPRIRAWDGDFQIVKIAHVLRATDISLMRLNNGIRYDDALFESHERRPVRITDIKDAEHLEYTDELYMENSFSGPSRALIAGRYFEPVGQDGKFDYKNSVVERVGVIHHTWSYLGNGAKDPKDGVCGSPMIDENNNLISFFRWIDENAMCLAIAATELQGYGYELVGQPVQG